MKILVASDSFKGSLSSERIGQILKDELEADHQVDFLPVSDGGEGFLESWHGYFKGSKVFVQTYDPLIREIQSEIILMEDGQAIIESAKTVGLNLLQPGELNPLKTSSFGLGVSIREAIRLGARKIYIGLGGSSTNDGGMGLLQALGVIFSDIQNHEITAYGAARLAEIKSIKIGELEELIAQVSFTGICDVNNPLLGYNGATYVYAPQKGADEKMLEALEAGISNFAEKTYGLIGKDLSETSGAGAAGGLGFCLRSYLNAELQSGIDVMLDLAGLNNKPGEYQLIITGEGKLDRQTGSGKVPFGILKFGRKTTTPVICICGINELGNQHDFRKVFSIVPDLASIDDSLKNPEYFLRKLIRELVLKWLKEV